MSRRLAASLRAILPALFLLLTPPASAAPIPALGLDNYQHSSWTLDNGGPPLIRAMAQTSDGWLWLSTADGLYRFDGLTFERYPMPAPYSANRSRVQSLHAHDNGDLYFLYFGQGLSVLHADGRMEDLARHPGMPESAFSSMAVDRDGSIWTVGQGIHHLHGGRWVEVDASPEWRAGNQRSILLDQDGRLWASNASGAWLLDRADGHFAKVSAHGGGLALAPDGAVWVIGGIGGQATRLATSASGAPRPDSFNARESRSAGVFDADGTLWALNCPDPLCLLPGATTRGAAGVLPASAAGLSSDRGGLLRGEQTGVVLEDREGNLWLSSQNGLHRFRPKRLPAAGLGRDGDLYSIAADAAGQVWAAERDSGKLWRLDQAQGQAPQLQAGVRATALAIARDGTLLIGNPRGIVRHGGDATARQQIAFPVPPGGSPADLHLIGILDDGKVLWAATMETGLIGWDGTRWLPKSAMPLPPHIYLVARGTGAAGQLWLGTIEGELVFYDNGRMTRHDMRQIGFGSGIFPGPQLTVAGEHGLAVLKDGKLVLLRAADPGVLRNVSGLVVGANGDRWLNGAAGVVHVRAADWARSMASPGEPLRYELFGALDGYPGQAAIEYRAPSAVSADGRHMWFLGTGGMVTLDTQALRRNRVPPAPRIQNVVTDAGTFAASSPLRLPAGSQQLRINFTAAALRAPERIRFQYRLDGVDGAWQDAGTRRMTMYTSVPPGTYAFRVRAINEDGVASTGDTVLRLAIAPTLLQSTPFRLACALLLLALGVALYRYRVRYLTSRLMERMVVKTTERERIARMLHDTILQTVQALMLRLDAVAVSLPAGDRTRKQLETLVGHASGAIAEGRDQVHELRAASPQLAEDIVADCIGRLRELYPQLEIVLRIDGASRPLHPAAADEAGNIACEALRNACAHAQATRVVVRLAYGWRKLTVSVRDDGCGLDSKVARDGYRNGHWGMIGMRERADRLGARLTIDSGAGKGTTVTLVVTARRAYTGK